MNPEISASSQPPLYYPESMRVTDTLDEGGIVLTRISDYELDTHLPLSDSTLQYLPAGAAKSPKDIREELAGTTGCIWGIYPETRCGVQRIPVGIVAITQGENAFSKKAASTTTILFDKEQHGRRGYGTAAKLAVMTMAYAGGIEVFGTLISEENLASQRSSAKVGYVPLHEPIARPVQLPAGPSGESSQWRTWVAVSPHADIEVPEDVLSTSRDAFSSASKRYKLELVL
jgi:hypothetical protein